MARKAPGKHYRKGITLFDLFDMFPDEASAEEWFVKLRWPNGICCPSCGSMNVQVGTAHPTMPYRCREKECDTGFFSVKTGSAMQSSKLPYRIWIVAMYLLATNLKSMSSMKLHRALGITQKSAWHLAHRLREARIQYKGLFSGPVEVDETYFGGKRANMSNKRRKEMAALGRGTAGKMAVVGARDRHSKAYTAKAVRSTGKKKLQKFVAKHVDPDAKVYTDDAAAYEGMPFEHHTVKHSAREFVRGDVHTNNIESLWSMMKRAYMGTFHKMSDKHLNRYIREFTGKANARELDTIDIMKVMAIRMRGRRLRYRDLIRDNGLDSGARPCA